MNRAACDRSKPEVACAPMITTRWVLGALLFGGLLVLDGCGGSGQYRIPTVDPVVKQKSSEDDDLLKELEGDDDTKASGGAKEAPPAKSDAAPATSAEPPAKTEAPAPAAKAPAKTKK